MRVCRACLLLWGKPLIKKNFVFWSHRKNGFAGFNKKKIISITFKEKNEREEGAMKAKHDERERERERGVERKSSEDDEEQVFSLRVFVVLSASYCALKYF